MNVLLIALLAIAVLALAVAALERTQGRATEYGFRHHLLSDVARQRVRIQQLELMLDEARSNALEISGPEQRDGHLLVSAPGLLSAERSDNPTTPAIHSVALSIDTLPEPLRSELRAIEGDDTQREYLELIQRELANGADVEALNERLFGV